MKTQIKGNGKKGNSKSFEKNYNKILLSFSKIGVFLMQKNKNQQIGEA